MKNSTCWHFIVYLRYKMRRSFCLKSLATSILEGWTIFHLKGDIHSFVSSTSSFLCDIWEPWYKQNKMGYQISRIRNTVLLQCWGKKALHEKGIFGPKKMFFRNFLFQLCEDCILWADALEIRWFAWVIFAQEFF